MNLVNEPASLFALIMAVAVAAPFLSDGLGIPVIVSMTILGVLLGPSATGILDSTILLQFMGSIGLVFVFFSAGLELDFEQIRKHPKSTLLFGILTFILPFSCGYVFGLLLFEKSVASSLLMGAFFASSGPLASQEKIRPDILERESVQTGRTGMGLSRLFVVLVLFASGRLYLGVNAILSIHIIALQIFYFLAIFFLLPRLVSFVIRKSNTQGTTDGLFIIFSLYAISALGPLVGIPGYVGAFFAGFILAPIVSSTKSISSRIGFIGQSIFIPFLLVFIGVSADFSRILSVHMVVIIIVGSVVLGLGSKLLAASISGRLLRYSSADQGLLFGFSSSFGIFSLVFTSIAGTTGLFDQPLVSGALILVVVSSLAAEIIARSSGSSILFKKGKEKSPDIRAGGRIMVALSKPASAPRLIDLAIDVHSEDPTLPILPCTIFSEAEDGAESRQFAETMLAAAIMQGVSAQVSIIPISRTAINVAEGILESAQEQKVDTILIGWNKPPKLANAFFGSVIDQILGSGNHMVMVTRAVSRLRANHIIAIVPTLSDHHPGFGRAVVTLNAIAKRNHSKVHVISLHAQGSKMEASLKKAGLASMSQYSEIETWKDIGKGIQKIPVSPKVFILLSARPSEPSWHPAIERLPHKLGEEFPESNLIIIYMARNLESAGGISNLKQSSPESSKNDRVGDPAMGYPDSTIESSMNILKNAIYKGTVRVNMQHTAIADGIFELVSAAFPFDRKLAGRLGSKLTEIVQRQPIEIHPGAVLLHERIAAIDTPLVCIGSHKHGFRVSLLEKPVKILIIIFMPETASPETHLSFLADIALLFRDRNLSSRLLEAETAEELL
jgi:Kef-type K+ transport system membrane component KefB